MRIEAASRPRSSRARQFNFGIRAQGLKARKTIAQGKRSAALGQRIKNNSSPEGAKEGLICRRHFHPRIFCVEFSCDQRPAHQRTPLMEHEPHSRQEHDTREARSLTTAPARLSLPSSRADCPLRLDRGEG